MPDFCFASGNRNQQRGRSVTVSVGPTTCVEFSHLPRFNVETTEMVLTQTCCMIHCFFNLKLKFVEADLGEIRNNGPLLNHPSNSQISFALLSGIIKGNHSWVEKKGIKGNNSMYRATFNIPFSQRSNPMWWIHWPDLCLAQLLAVVCDVGMFQIPGKEV